MALPGVTDEMIKCAQDGDTDAMWALVSAHDPVIRQIISQVAPGASSDAAEDLMQEGRAELIHRVRSYDASSSAAQLQTYAYRGVRRAVTEAHITSTCGFTIDPTTVLRVRRALATYEGSIEAAVLSVARHDISRERFMAVLDALTVAESLDSAPPGAEDGLTYADTIADASGDITEPAERRDLARHLLTVVSPRQSYALAAHHGVGMAPAPDVDVADHLRVNPRNVRQLRSDGAKSARKWAAENHIAA